MRKLATCSLLNNTGNCPESTDSPLQMKLINYLGLKKYMIDNFIFRRKSSKYAIRKKGGVPRLYTDHYHEAPTGYTLQTTIIQTSSHSIPICRLIPIEKSNNHVIVYAHGNASDMADSLEFAERLSQLIHTEYVIFDYSGYGESRVTDVGEEIICRDLEIVLAWVIESRKIRQIILWGFSLGTYPVVTVAAKYPIETIILQCPIASISCIFHSELHPDMKFKEDYFANIDNICAVRGKILIIHSSADQIIPFSHGKLLFEKFVRKNGEQKIELIEIGKIGHNSLHRYIVSQIQNQLQREVFGFLLKSIYQQNSKSSRTSTCSKSRNILRSTLSLSTEVKNENEKELLSLRMKVLEAPIEEAPEDMDELVIEGTQSQKITVLRAKTTKNCFCFASNQT